LTDQITFTKNKKKRKHSELKAPISEVKQLEEQKREQAELKYSVNDYKNEISDSKKNLK